jgi:hypothetical protein
MPEKTLPLPPWDREKPKMEEIFPDGEAKKQLTSADRLLAAQEVMEVLEKYEAKEY